MNSNLTSKQRREISRLEQMNDAEQIQYAESHMDRPFKHLKADSFNKQRPVFVFNTEREVPRDRGLGFAHGDRVIMTKAGRMNGILCGDSKDRGTVGGVYQESRMVVVDGRLYSADLWRKA